jgi:hypothetical protein
LILVRPRYRALAHRMMAARRQLGLSAEPGDRAATATLP